MERTDLLNEFKTILAEHVNGEGTRVLESLHEQTSLKNDLGIDSLEVINIVIDIENHFHVEIEDECIRKLSTIANCIDLVDQKVNGPLPYGA